MLKYCNLQQSRCYSRRAQTSKNLNKRDIFMAGIIMFAEYDAGGGGKVKF